MSEQNLTASAQRALTEICPQVKSTRESPYFLLLKSFLASEGRATAILRAAHVELAGPIPRWNADDPVQYQEWRRQLIRRADHFALQLSGNVPTGSEHLLLAAVDMDSATAELLAGSGLTLDSIQTQVRVIPPELDVPENALVQLPSAEPGIIDETGLFRILDASANRAREGLRVIEDYVRFRLNDSVLSAELKAIRHQITASLNALGQERWTSARDTLHDVGTAGTLASERERGGMSDVLRANLKRVEEALRSLEEYSKLLDSDLSRKLSECRYRLYTVEKSLEATLQSRQRLQDCQLYLLVTAANCRYGAERTIRDSLEKGVDIVQIREKELPVRELIAFAEQVRKWTADAGKMLIMNDRADVAVAVGADGVHLGQEDLSVHAARRIMGGKSLIGVSTHAPAQARQAIFDGADYLGVGPTFPSETKQFTEFAGLDYVSWVAQNICIPWFAIGGIHLKNTEEVLAAGATRVAVSNAICQSPHPRGVVTEFKEKLQRSPQRIFQIDPTLE